MDDDRGTRRPLRRRFRVRLSPAEEATLRGLEGDRTDVRHLDGRPRFVVRGDGRWRGTIFRRLGAQQGVRAAQGDVVLVGPGEARVVVRSGGRALGWTCAVLAVLFLLSPLLVLLPGEWLERPLGGWLATPVFGALAWWLLARRSREPHLDALEEFLRQRVGGRWERTDA